MSRLRAYLGACAKAVEQAAAWTGVVLFRPPSPVHWLGLTVCAWLMQCPRHVHISEFYVPGSFPYKTPNETGVAAARNALEFSRSVREWALGHLSELAVFAAATLALTVALVWIGALASFAFLDNTASNRHRLHGVWRIYAGRATVLSGCRIGLFVALMAVMTALVAVMVAGALGIGLAARGLPLPVRIAVALAAVTVVAIVAVGVLLAYAVAAVCVDDLLVPLAFKYNQRPVVLIGYVSRMAHVHGIGIVLFTLLKGMLQAASVMLVGMTMIFFLLLTRLVMGRPDALLSSLGMTTILLPLFVFFRALGPAFLAQLSPEYTILGKTDAAPSQP